MQDLINRERKNLELAKPDLKERVAINPVMKWEKYCKSRFIA